MKLRNKKTGEIGYTAVLQSKAIVVMDENAIQLASYTTLAELNADWKDAPEEPKEYWYIDTTEGAIVEHTCEQFELTDKERKEIGNLFETEEEAELAVRKLKAWKRLKDKGFRFIDHIDRDSGQGMTRYEWDGYINGEDLDLLFGGEE